jgi:diketogulonate reductase-like aldo/keto reductase
VLSWGLQRGTIVIPKSNSVERLKENMDSMKIKLSEEEMKSIDAIDEGFRICDNDTWLGTSCIFT